jgi:hypothetical protein
MVTACSHVNSRRLALDQLHREPHAPVVFARLQHLHDAGVVEFGGDARFALEAGESLRACVLAGGDDLQGDI